MQSNWLNSVLSPVVYGDIALSINTQYNLFCLHKMLLSCVNHLSFMGFGFIYLGFYVAFNTIQVISRRVVGRAEETSTYSSLGLCTVNCRPMASNY